jgi:hypothetical protein
MLLIECGDMNTISTGAAYSTYIPEHTAISNFEANHAYLILHMGDDN